MAKATLTVTSASDRISSSIQQLDLAATEINVLSDELGKMIGRLEAIIKRLGLGVSVWTEIGRSGDGYVIEYIGYAKVNGKWGIALSTISEPDEDGTDWLFTDAPRQLRLTGLSHLPDLLEKMVLESKNTADQLQAGIRTIETSVAPLESLSSDGAKKR